MSKFLMKNCSGLSSIIFQKKCGGNSYWTRPFIIIWSRVVYILYIVLAFNLYADMIELGMLSIKFGE